LAELSSVLVLMTAWHCAWISFEVYLMNKNWKIHLQLESGSGRRLQTIFPAELKS
jgi:hypothetical protein